MRFAFLNTGRSALLHSFIGFKILRPSVPHSVMPSTQLRRLERISVLRALTTTSALLQPFPPAAAQLTAHRLTLCSALSASQRTRLLHHHSSLSLSLSLSLPPPSPSVPSDPCLSLPRTTPSACGSCSSVSSLSASRLLSPRGDDVHSLLERNLPVPLLLPPFQRLVLLASARAPCRPPRLTAALQAHPPAAAQGGGGGGSGGVRSHGHLFGTRSLVLPALLGRH